ncbi:acetyl-CoA synthetase, putative [Marinomonas sp. MED121]|uniref:acetate--CoA ligase family protein n=1 Tax=Marinomonas sp. MED121 TaxID=314277 RepID=UPI0000690FE2|nr:acetate--CoA ligase family protein [Marinomonas sp. MED121]EAQ67324.1 acetyl-CoA synthetase, putative [Marinomonas sp. MED121]
MTLSNTHYLDRLLKPETIALVGVSPREGTVGNDMLKVLLSGGYKGQVFLVNPRYDEIEGHKCFASLSDIPVAIDMAVLSVASHRMEPLFDEAISLNIGGVTIFDYCKLEEEASPTLLERLSYKAKQANMPICGGNCMGYYNFDNDAYISFQSPGERKAGHISLIAHSGSIFVLPTSNDRRFRFNLVVSAGQEIATSLDEYMDFALEQESTRVLAIFMEAIRNPENFVKVLEKAKRKGIPVVVTKVGRTEVSAQLAATHSGAIAGNNTAYEALFKKYGVIATDSLDDLMTCAQILSQGGDLGAGDLGYIGDSGGLRELFVDTAEEHDLTFANLTDDTMNKLKQRLPLGLEAVNPLDAAGPFTPDYAEVFRDSVRYIMEDPNVAVGVFEFEARDEFIYMPEFIEIAKEVKQYSNKPFIVLNTFSLALNAGIAEDLMDHDIPLVNGVENAVKAIANLFANRDQQADSHTPAENISNPARKEKWHARLATGLPMSETDSLNLLADYGIGIANPQEAHTQEDTLKAVETMTFPVVLKTAEPHIHHKSDVGGVKLNLNSSTEVSEAYDDLANRLGYRVTIEPMVGQGTELAFGMVNDPQFGPMVMVGSGGIYIEVLKDRVFSLAPFDEIEAMAMIDSLRTRPLLAGVRGAKAADLNQLAKQLANFSHLAADLGDDISEIDVNPIIVNDKGSIAVDALVIAKEVDAEQSAA